MPFVCALPSIAQVFRFQPGPPSAAGRGLLCPRWVSCMIDLLSLQASWRAGRPSLFQLRLESVLGNGACSCLPNRTLAPHRGDALPSPQCGLRAQNRCCCRGAFLFSALTSEACRERLSSLACQARHAHLFPVFPGYLRPHGSLLFREGLAAPPAQVQAWGAPRPRRRIRLGNFVGCPAGLALASCPWRQLGSNWALGLSQVPATFSRGSLCFA